VTQTRFIVVTGGVLSGLGKGITTSSIGRLLKASGLSVTAVKIDPYVNCDAGTMNPFEHGEVFVLEDGGEVDLDLGNYERFLDTNIPKDNNLTTGKVYRSVIEKERQGEYLGKTVQIVPHVTEEIRERVEEAAAKANADVCLVEVGGTVGDMDSMPFLEGLRQLSREHGRDNVVFVHTTLVPILAPVGEQKTKPTQHSVKELKATGIEPDMIVCRCEEPLAESTREKISHFCDVDTDAVVGAPDVDTKYQVPLLIHDQGVDDWLEERLDLDRDEPDLDPWKRFLDGVQNPTHDVEIAIVGKYTELEDAYMSITEAFNHAGSELSTDVGIRWVDSDELTLEDLAEADDPDGILVPGGFGARGTQGKINAIRYAREEKIPFLGICYGFQLAVVEFARNVLGLEDATSKELMEERGIDSENPVIDLLPEQRSVDAKGGTMRLGATPVRIDAGTTAHELYGTELVLERHRHRYEVNPRYHDDLIDHGLTFSGCDSTGLRMEILEHEDHPFFLGSQFHPEFKSRPGDPAPLFRGLVQATLKADDGV
jgi:CTP synthase